MAVLEIPTERSAMGFEEISVDATAIGFTQAEWRSAPGLNARSAYVAVVTLTGTAGTNDIRWTVDGTTPTGTLGHILVAGDSLIIKGTGNITKFRAIKDGATAGTISVSYF